MYLLIVAHLWALKERLRGKVPAEKNQSPWLFALAQP